MVSPKAPLKSVRLPIEEVRKNLVYAPECDRAALRGTSPGRGDTTVSFCVDANGKTRDVNTTGTSANDAAIDEICRTTVKKWRFKPFSEDGVRVEVCTTVTFALAT